MNESKLLGRLQMTHSRIIQQNDKNNKENEAQQKQYFDMLAKSAHKSYIGHKSHNIKEVKQLDGKQLMKQRKKIFPKSTIYPKSNKQIESKKDYDLVKIEQVSNKQTKTCNCFGSSTNLMHQLEIIQDKILLVKNMNKKSFDYVFNFDTVQVILQESFSIYQSKQFILNSGSLKLRISHEDKSIIRYWFDKINLIVKESFGVKFQMNDLSIKYPTTFYKTRFQTQDYFTQNCQTGDILLFQDDHFFAKAQRFITNSNYDHVAMVIKDKTYGVLMFQANSMSGVTLTPWNCIVKYGWYQCINRIVWRKLQDVDRGGYFQKIVHQFIRANLKQNYYISFDKLLSNQSYIAKKTQEKGFFCSELIATVYKDLELLTRDKQSKDYMPGTKFYPYHFSQKFDLKLQMGKLSPQYEVHFNKKMLQNSYGEFLQQK